MNKLIFYLLLICLKQGIGQTFVLIPDQNFRTYLQNTIPSAIVGNSLNITSTLVTNCTSLNINGQNISSILGIHHFISLQSLLCNSNLLTSFPELPNSLKTLRCDFNFLQNLPTLPNSLQILSCYNNSLTSIPALPNSLETLHCSGNKLTNLPILPNSLLSLECGGNQLTSLPPLPYLLQTLICNSNFLTKLPQLPNSLNYLYCIANNISCFPLFPTSINNISISYNPFYCIPNYIPAMDTTLLAFPICSPETNNGCATVGIEENNLNKYPINIFPNPTNGQFTIESVSIGVKLLQLFDLNGQLLLEQSINNKATIEVHNLNAGVYNVIIKTVDNIETIKLVIIN